MRRRSKLISIILVSIAGLVLWFGYEVVHGMNRLGTWQMGMIELHLPSGATVYVRHQTNEGEPEYLYLSAVDDYCTPYDRWHDYKLSTFGHGQPQPPVFMSYSGNTIIVHSSDKPKSPWLVPKSFKLEFQPLSPTEYSAYSAGNANALPDGWQRIEVPFGNNTCAL